jgi:hypothetical protein
MSNPTTPFGWQMPEATDLVTDLPADFEVFGQAVATDLQYLLGGTTGQVLAKASGTDLDFDWVTDATGMTNPMTTTADVIYSSSGSTPARLGIGTAGQVLQVNSGATAPEWATPAAGGMTVLATGTLSSTLVSLTGISGSYIDLYLAISNPYLISTADPLTYRFNGQTAGYNSTGMQTSNNTLINTTGGASMSPSINKNLPTSTNSHSSTVYIRNYTSTSRKTILMTYDTGTGNETTLSIGNLGSAGASAITSIDIRTELGTITFGGGTYTLYGVK